MDGQEGRPYDEIAGRPIFSPDGKHVAYGAKKGDKWLVCIDGQEDPIYDRIVEGGPTFHKDGILEYLGVADGVLFRVKHQAWGAI